MRPDDRRWIKRNFALRPYEAARQWLALNSDQPVTIREAAQIAGYSPSHFTRAFTESYGESPRDYLARLRIEKAVRLLAGSKISVQEAASEVGFGSLPTFCNRFKALTGQTPAEFQRAALAHSRETGQPANPVIPTCLSGSFSPPKISKPE
ncbi:MAG: helix-turn-helix transcriptional regulator [Armatimonadetes bacterium]|nr:helix-turn-helix transcriptional regulator [Armatimonadota bacterium]